VIIGYSSLACASDRSPVPRLCFPFPSTCTDIQVSRSLKVQIGTGRAVGLLRKILVFRGVTKCDQTEICCVCLQGSSECVCEGKNTKLRSRSTTGEAR
jgi:hypothetical protein